MSLKNSNPGEYQDVDSIKAGDFVFREGDAVRDFFIVVLGQFELLKGGRRVELLGTGDPFGEEALADDAVRRLSARAMTDGSILRVDVVTFAELIRQHVDLAWQLMRRMALRLLYIHQQPAAERSVAAARDEAAPRPEAASRPALHGDAADARTVPLAARFVHAASGAEFPLPSNTEVLIGRSDPDSDFSPDVQLDTLDNQRSLSRRHARILRQDDGFYVCEEPHVPNGTFVNGKRLKAGVPAKIVAGDEVGLGLIKLVFRTD